MKVILKKDLKSAKFNVVFKKGIALHYSPELKAVQHPTEPNVYLTVTEKQFEVAKNYVIMGDNNFWYSTTGHVTKKGLQEAIKEVKQGIKENTFDGADGEPSELHVFETGESETIEL